MADLETEGAGNVQGHAAAQAPMEPYATPKSVLHCVLCAEEDAAAGSALLDDVACCYQGCRLGSHAPMPGRAVFIIPHHAASCAPCSLQQPARPSPPPPSPLQQSWPASTTQQQAPPASTQAPPASPSQKAAASSMLSEGTGRDCGCELPLPLAVRNMAAAVTEAATQLQQRLLHAPPCLRCCLCEALQGPPPQCCSGEPSGVHQAPVAEPLWRARATLHSLSWRHFGSLVAGLCLQMPLAICRPDM